MKWHEAAYEVLGGDDEPANVRHDVELLESWTGGPLPDAVREWYLRGGGQRLAAVSANLVTRTRDFDRATVGRFLDHGFLLLETDSQHCCRWVVAVSATDDDPPVYLIDPDDDACVTRSRYAATFSDYAFAHAWDAALWAEPDLLTEFDRPLPAGALDALTARLTTLPVTHGWAMNQGCDAVHRFGGAARVAVAVDGGVALWSAIAGPLSAMRDTFARLIGVTRQIR